MKRFKLTDKFLSEIIVNKPQAPYSGLPREIVNKTKDIVVSFIIDSFHPDLSYFFDEYDVFRPFIIDQMIFNNYEVFKNGEEILVSYNNEDLIDEKDIEEYIESNPKLENYLYKLLFKFYEENVDINCIFNSAIKQVKKDIDVYIYDDGDPDVMRRLQSPKYAQDFIERSVDKIIDNGDCNSYYLEDVIYDGDFESYLKQEFNQADVINEMRINKPFKYDRAYGEIHSWEEYAKVDPNPNNFLVDISKGKIIAAFTGWNVPTWSRQAEKNDNNLFVSSKSGITNPPPYLRTPHIDIDNPNSWEPRSVAMSLIRKYSKLDEIHINKPTSFNRLKHNLIKLLEYDKIIYPEEIEDINDTIEQIKDSKTEDRLRIIMSFYTLDNEQYYFDLATYKIRDNNPLLKEIRVNKPRKFHPGEEVIVYGEKYPLSTFSEKYYKEEDGISYYLVDDVKNTGQRFWIEQDKIKKIKSMKENISKQSFAERFLESFNKEIKKTITQIDKASLLNENETAYHGSSNYFRQFQEAGIGGGTGAQIFGWGLYFGKNPEIAKGYTTAGPNAGKTKTLFQGKTAEELGLEYENEVFFGLPRGLETAQDYVDYAQEMISIIEEEPEFDGKEDVLKSYARFIEIIRDLEIEQEPMQYLYKVTLFPNKTPDYLNWDAKIPQTQVDKINKKAQENDMDVQVNTSMTGATVYHTIEKYFSGKSKFNHPPKDTSLFLLNAGIDGVTHSNGSVRIVFNAREIQIDKVYKAKEFKDVKESKIQLNEYSEKIIKQMTDKWQKEMKNTLSNDDIKEKIQRFDQIKSNLTKKIEAGLKGEAGGITVPKKFTEPDSKTGKTLNPQDILGYTWNDLEAVLDAYGSKAEKTSKDFATVQDADLVDIKGVPVIYNKDGIKIYEGSNYENCIKLNYAFKYKGEDNKIYSYQFCIGRKEPASNQYYTYRFGRGGGFRSFYFVADSTQNADIKGNPTDRKNFVNWYHFFVIHAFDNGKYGVTDAVNQWGGEHENTGGDKGISWEEVGKFMVKNGGESGKKAWDKIEGLKDLFKYVPASQEETDQALVKDKILNFDSFKNLNRNQKRIYISNRADQPNAFTSDMFKILDVELKNLALRTGSGYKATYNDLKDSNALLRSYTKFRFTRGIDDYKRGKSSITVLPLPFVKYLTDEEKQQYLDTFNEYTFEYLEKYFGEKITKDYVNKTAKELSFLPPAAIKYISDPKLKQLYELYIKLFENWKYGDNTNIDDEKLANMGKMPIQDINPIPIDEKQWLKLSTPERKTIINLAEKFNKNRKYDVMLLALPFIIEDKGQKYVLVPKNANKNSKSYESWVMMDDQGKIIKDNIPGDYMLGEVYLSEGFPEENDDFNRIYNINDLKAND